MASVAGGLAAREVTPVVEVGELSRRPSSASNCASPAGAAQRCACRRSGRELAVRCSPSGCRGAVAAVDSRPARDTDGRAGAGHGSRGQRRLDSRPDAATVRVASLGRGPAMSTHLRREPAAIAEPSRACSSCLVRTYQPDRTRSLPRTVSGAGLRRPGPRCQHLDFVMRDRGEPARAPDELPPPPSQQATRLMGTKTMQVSREGAPGHPSHAGRRPPYAAAMASASST